MRGDFCNTYSYATIYYLNFLYCVSERGDDRKSIDESQGVVRVAANREYTAIDRLFVVEASRRVALTLHGTRAGESTSDLKT